MTAYLIEYSASGDHGRTVSLMDAGELAAFLAKNVEHAHYSGDEYDVIRMFRYADGALIPLHLARPESGYADADDYLHYPYEVWPVGGPTAATPEFTFTVTIDGRA